MTRLSDEGDQLSPTRLIIIVTILFLITSDKTQLSKLRISKSLYSVVFRSVQRYWRIMSSLSKAVGLYKFSSRSVQDSGRTHARTVGKLGDYTDSRTMFNGCTGKCVRLSQPVVGFERTFFAAFSFSLKNWCRYGIWQEQAPCSRNSAIFVGETQ